MDIAFWTPWVRALMWAGITLCVLPVPNRINISVKFVCVIKAVHKTTISVSTVRSVSRRHPSVAASAVCRRSLVSASSCVHGERRLVFAAGEFSRINLPKVDMIFPSLSIFTDSCARNAKSSFLLSSILRNTCQLPGILVSGWTRRLVPFPRFFLVAALRLSWMYSSQMMSTLLGFWSWNRTSGKNTTSEYSLKVFAEPGLRMFMTTAPSSRIASTSGMESVGAGYVPWKHSRRSAFVPERSSPNFDSAGG